MADTDIRLLFGISAYSEIFPMIIDEIFEGLSGMTAIVDDILVFGRTRKDHGRNLRNDRDQARNMGICVNPDKMALNIKKCSFLWSRDNR